jgi:hypothetical protein
MRTFVPDDGSPDVSDEEIEVTITLVYVSWLRVDLMWSKSKVVGCIVEEEIVWEVEVEGLNI